MTEGPFLWYLNRGSGLVLLVLLTASTVLGVLAMGGRPGRGLPRFVTQALHRNLALLSVVALAVHVASAVLDTFVDIRWWNAVIPAGAGYEPFWVGLGTLSLDLIAVIVITSLLRSRLSHGTWRRVHQATWLCWALAVVHTIGIGTDLKDPTVWAVIPTGACILAVLVAASVRLGRLSADREPAGSRS